MSELLSEIVSGIVSPAGLILCCLVAVTIGLLCVRAITVVVAGALERDARKQIRLSAIIARRIKTRRRRRDAEIAHPALGREPAPEARGESVAAPPRSAISAEAEPPRRAA